jgi:hypothetical protein
MSTQTIFEQLTQYGKGLGYALGYDHGVQLNEMGWTVRVAFTSDGERAHYSYAFADDETALEKKMVEALAFTLALPTLVEWKRAKFREKLVAMGEEAEELEIGIEYAALLKATAERLASNALTGPRGEWTPHTPDDPMPTSADAELEVGLRNGQFLRDKAERFNWDRVLKSDYAILAWRYAA